MKKYWKIVGICIGTCICILAVSYFWHGSDSDVHFDPTAWKKAEDTNERLKMVHDLMSKYTLVGMKKEEIEKLLGSPRMDVSGRLLPDYNYVYLLGTKQWLLDEDGVWLCIKLQDNQVRDVQICHD